MKKRSLSSTPLFSIILSILSIIIFSCLAGCTDKCEVTQTYIFYEPVYKALNEVREAIRIEAPQDLENPGKIYIYGNTLFINEPGKGIHIVDNTNPQTPVVKAFITVPGSYDIAVIGNILYTDSYIDLVALDINDINNIRETGRAEGIFTEMSTFSVNAEGIITEYVETTKKEEFEECETGGPMFFRGGGVWMEDMLVSSLAFSQRIDAGMIQTGKGGSMARFAIQGKHLYAVGTWQLRVVDISNITQPVLGQLINLNAAVETIFPYNNNLFIGTTTGMIIYDSSIPEYPSHVSTYQHITSCDPVAIEGNYAYVTLRSGNNCRNSINELHIVDITDLKKPTLQKSYKMINPHGVGIDNGTLFICEGEHGLKVFDAKNTNDLQEISYFREIHSYDVIPYNNVLIMTGNDGIYQYDYKDKQDIKLLSRLKVSNQ